MTTCPSPPPEPPASFEAPWHGQVFALAVAMNEAGHFTWPEWTRMFGAQLNEMRQDHALDGSEDYYLAWVSALEQMMVEKDIVAPQLLDEMKTLWTEAFLRTPHGKPVIPDKPAGLRA
ncbi:nitrile hydratase accessory protein [Alisedimentitalea sp. MJ-SS2]|uniref:nitrile hydratase accessory protein n=1 Tax=Aliisedimentitalea sp. MJ-SS2 TaxID=3049795 RepID=UPI00290FAD08|nr:nitrile hydratase accessory protein [Alisedimentitalea sp. MJ-SS2]MDU8927259.1 nitrile hydratase accessory protein [Alisedimentitalea sp. MJ-SS2]